MKIDRTKLIQDIEAMKEKLASMEEELNKPEEFKRFPSNGDIYYFYTPMGTICRSMATNDKLKFNVFKSEKEAQKAYNKAVAVEKIKRRILELQGDWKPDFNDTSSSKHIILYSYYNKRFKDETWQRVKYLSVIPYIKTSEITETIINEMEDELKLIFDIS